MKKIILATALVLSATIANEAQSAGLYLGAGYGRIKPKLSNRSVSEASDNYTGFENTVAGWPDRNDDSPLMGNSDGFQAAPWGAGLPQESIFDSKNGNEYSFAIGWKIPRNPFSFEVEYKMMDNKIDGEKLVIHDPNGILYSVEETKCVDGSLDPNCTEGDIIHYAVDRLGVATQPVRTDRYEFDIQYIQPDEVKINALMLNAYFEIPGFGPIDPYVGYGIGKAKTEMTYTSEKGSGGSDGYVSASQYMAGIDYRISGTPWIIGAEYRKFKSNFDEKDDKIPYKSDNESIMVKAKYDFVSDRF